LKNLLGCWILRFLLTLVCVICQLVLLYPFSAFWKTFHLWVVLVRRILFFLLSSSMISLDSLPHSSFSFRSWSIGTHVSSPCIWMMISIEIGSLVRAFFFFFFFFLLLNHPGQGHFSSSREDTCTLLTYGFNKKASGFWLEKSGTMWTCVLIWFSLTTRK